MGDARQAMARMTAAMVNRDREALAAAYAPDAIAVTPDEGELKGREEIARYLGAFLTAIPDFHWESLAQHQSGDTAIDEGWVVGTNTGPVTLPDGDTLPATGKAVRVAHRPPPLLLRPDRAARPAGAHAPVRLTPTRWCRGAWR
jgi:ketosteroid isomerase-like protein